MALVPKIFKLAHKKLPLGRENVVRIAKACERFEEVEFEKPSFSAFELQQTPVERTFRNKQVKVCHGLMWQALSADAVSIKIVGEDLCKIKTKEPTMIGFDTDYSTLCIISVEGFEYQNLSAFIRRAIADSQYRIMMLYGESELKSAHH